jgi:hypothetical protein
MNQNDPAIEKIAATLTENLNNRLLEDFQNEVALLQQKLQNIVPSWRPEAIIEIVQLLKGRGIDINDAVMMDDDSFMRLVYRSIEQSSEF